MDLGPMSKYNIMTCVPGPSIIHELWGTVKGLLTISQRPHTKTEHQPHVQSQGSLLWLSPEEQHSSGSCKASLVARKVRNNPRPPDFPLADPGAFKFSSRLCSTEEWCPQNKKLKLKPNFPPQAEHICAWPELLQLWGW